MQSENRQSNCWSQPRRLCEAENMSLKISKIDLEMNGTETATENEKVGY